MVLRWRKRGSQKYGLALFLFFVILLIYQALLNSDPSLPEKHLRVTDEQLATNPLLAEQAKFWRALYTHILFNDPQCTPPELVGIPHRVDIGFDPDHDRARPDVLWLKPADVEALKNAHVKYLRDIERQPPALPFVNGTRGIVLTAGRTQLPVLVISILMLRRTGSTLPVEVFLASKEDYNTKVCDYILPDLNAKCLIFDEIVQAAGSGVSLAGYQYKAMALMFSSFESVLLLDSDAFPVTDPESVFDSTVFQSYGMILYPDFWFASESPYFFEIASISDIPLLSARPAKESGELFIDKRKHNATLLLAAYYNYYGPDYYYVLLSQGAPGQGDKETFGWAATATNSSYYFVHTPVVAVGHIDSTGEFSGSAMAQHDPRVDYERHHLQTGDTIHADDAIYPASAPKPNLSNDSDVDSTGSNDILRHRVPISFLHANFPKFDPSTLFLSSTQPPGKPNPTFDSNGTSVRPWGATLSPPYTWTDGYDIEHAFWEEIEVVSCKYGRDMAAFGDWSLTQIISGNTEAADGKDGKSGGEQQSEMDVCSVVRAWKMKVFGNATRTAT